MLNVRQNTSCEYCENFVKQISAIHEDYSGKIRALNMDNEILKIQIQKLCQNGNDFPQPDLKNDMEKLIRTNECLGRELKKLKLENQKQNQSNGTCASFNQSIQEGQNRFSQSDLLSNNQSDQTVHNNNNIVTVYNKLMKSEAALERERKWSQEINENYTKLLVEADALRLQNGDLKQKLESAEQKINELSTKRSRSKTCKTTVDKIKDDKNEKKQPRLDYVKKICNTPFYKDNKKSILEIEKCFKKFPIFPLDQFSKVEVADVIKKMKTENTKTTKVKEKILTNKMIHNVSEKRADGGSKNKEQNEKYLSDISDLPSLDDSDHSVTPLTRNPSTNDENLSKNYKKNTHNEIEIKQTKFSTADKRKNSDDKHLSDSDSSCDVSLDDENDQTDRKTSAQSVDSRYEENQTAQLEVNIKGNDADKVVNDYLFEGFFDQTNSTSMSKNPSITSDDQSENNNENHPPETDLLKSNRYNNTKEFKSRIENYKRKETSDSETSTENISKSGELSCSNENKEMDRNCPIKSNERNNQNHQTEIGRQSNHNNRNKVKSVKSLTNDYFYTDEKIKTQSKSIPKSNKNEEVSMGIDKFSKTEIKKSKKKYFSRNVDLDESENCDESNEAIDVIEETLSKTTQDADELIKESQSDNFVKTNPVSLNKSPIEEENVNNVNDSDNKNVENQEKSEKIVLPKRKIEFEHIKSCKKRKLNDCNEKIKILDQSSPNKLLFLSVNEGNKYHERQSVIDNPGSPSITNQPEPDNLNPNNEKSNAFADIDFENPVFIMNSDFFSMKFSEASDEPIDRTTPPKTDLLTSNQFTILNQSENSLDKATVFDNPIPLQIDNQTESDNPHPIIDLDIPDDFIMNFDTICNSTIHKETPEEPISESQHIATSDLPSDTNQKTNMNEPIQDKTDKSIENQDLVNSHISSPIINQPETNNSNPNDQQWGSFANIDFHNSDFSFVDCDFTEPIETNLLTSDPQESVKDNLEKSSEDLINKLSEDIDQSQSINDKGKETFRNEIDTTEMNDYKENNDHQSSEWKFFETEDVMEMHLPCYDEITPLTELDRVLPFAIFTNSENNKENEKEKRNVDPSESMEVSFIIERSLAYENMDCVVAESDRGNESINNDNTGKEHKDQHENDENNDKKPNNEWKFNIDEDLMEMPFDNDISFSTDFVTNLSFQVSNDTESSEENKKPETKWTANLTPQNVFQPQTSISSIENVSNRSIEVSSRKPNPGDLKPLEIHPDSRIDQKEKNLLIRKIKKILSLCVAKKFNFTPVFRGSNFPNGSECLFDLFLTNTFIFVSEKSSNYSINNLSKFLPRINQIMSTFLNLCCDTNRGLSIFEIRLIEWIGKLPLTKINFGSVRLLLCIAFDFHLSLSRTDLSVTLIIDLLENCRVPVAAIISAIDLKFIDYSDAFIERFQINVLITFLKFLLHYENKYCRHDTSECPLSEKGQQFWLRGMTDHPQATIVEYLRDQLIRHPDCLSLVNLLYSVVLKRCIY